MIMEGFIKVAVASGCAMLSGGLNIWLNVKDKKTITMKDIIVAFVPPMLMVVSTCALFI